MKILQLIIDFLSNRADKVKVIKTGLSRTVTQRNMQVKPLSNRSIEDFLPPKPVISNSGCE